ncbi:MAG: hypothetical protein AB4062_20280 [Crocosphaera sp.]
MVNHRYYGTLALLLLAGVLGNYFKLPLFFGVDFLFGSIAVFIVIHYYGVFWGTLAGALAGSVTYYLWDHPYALIIFIAETCFVAPELLEKLQQEQTQIWDNSRKTMITKELRQFTARLQQWGEDYHCQPLINYANRLERQRKEFDSENLAKTLEGFPQIVRSLQSEHSGSYSTSPVL